MPLTVFRYHLTSLSTERSKFQFNQKEQQSIRFEYPFDYVEIRTQQYEVITKNGQRRFQFEKYSKNQPSELWRILIFFLLVV